MSGSHPFISGDTSLGTTIDLSAGSQTLNFVISDLHGNALPAGTTVDFAVKNNEIVSTSGSFPVPNTIACIDKADHVNPTTIPPTRFWLTTPIDNGIDVCPAKNVEALSYSVRIKKPASPTPDPTGFLKLTVKSPKGPAVTFQYDTIY